MDKKNLKRRLTLINQEIQWMQEDYEQATNLRDRAWLKTRINELHSGIDRVLDKMNENQNNNKTL